MRVSGEGVRVRVRPRPKGKRREASWLSWPSATKGPRESAKTWVGSGLGLGLGLGLGFG